MKYRLALKKNLEEFYIEGNPLRNGSMLEVFQFLIREADGQKPIVQNVYNQGHELVICA